MWSAKRVYALTNLWKNPYTTWMQGVEPMLKYAEPQQAKRPPVVARPTQIDRQKLRAEINKRFSKTLAYLAK